MLRARALAPRRPHLFQSAGETALASVLQRGPLLAFDFDGTLAPIVARPTQARVSRCISGKLQRLSELLPIAIVTGRSVEDVRGRLQFDPQFILGNHGAELGGEARPARELDPVRREAQRRAGELAAAGIGLEDKGLSLALHYRLSRRPDHALDLIQDLLATAGAACRAFPGKMVINVVPQGAPDKGTAMLRLVAECGAPCAVFVGDDVNDEPVFACAPDDWLTVRVGREDPETRANFFLDSAAEVGMLLDRMLVHLGDH